MKLIETTVIGPFVRMRLADDPDPAKASQWIDFQVHAPKEADPSWGLAGFQRAALQTALDALNAEIQLARTALNRARG